jgi:mannose-6-phosphate isomerase-like protein (cupin superfamily)
VGIQGVRVRLILCNDNEEIRMPSTPFPPVHRVVTGHDAAGKAVVAQDGALPTVIEMAAVPGTVFHEIWSTAGAPAPVGREIADPTLGPLVLPPPKHGTRVRFVDFPPETPAALEAMAAHARKAFADIGDAKASTGKAGSPHPLMHRTETVDYGVVIDGEITLVLDDSEVALKAGSVVVQRGTNHAWANRSGRPCRMLFVLIDGAFEPSLAQTLKGR